MTLNAIPDADALVVLLDAKYLESKVEFEFIKNLLKSDRERKLFIVINKIDCCDGSAKSLISTCQRILTEYGVVPQKIYAISALSAFKKTLNQEGFNAFKADLMNFLGHGLKAETLRHVENEISSLSKLLISSCDEALKNVKMDAKSAQAKRKEMETTRDSVNKSYDSQLRELKTIFGQYRTDFILEFSNFMDNLNAVAAKEINASSLETLQNSDSLACKLKQEIVNFIEPKIADLQDKIEADINSSREKIISSLAGLNLPIKVEVKDISAYGGLFLPVVVGASFLLLGFFSFIWVVIAAVVGRNYFESAITKFLGRLSVNKIREKLIAEVNIQLTKAGEQLKNQLNECFETIEIEMGKSFSSACGQAVAPMEIIESMSTPDQVGKIRECRNKLEYINNN